MLLLVYQLGENYPRPHKYTYYYRLSSGVRALALALVPSTITDYLALALAQAKSKLSEYL